MAVEYLYLGRANTIDLVLRLDGDPVSDAVMDEITKIEIEFDDLVFSSTNQSGDPIRWRQTGYDTGEIRLFLNDEDIPVGRYKTPVYVFFPDAPEGFAWRTTSDDILEIQATEAGPCA